MSEYDLIYVRKKDKKIFHVKRVTPQDYNIKDPMTGFVEPVTQYRIRKDFECQKKFSDEAKLKKSCIKSLIIPA